MNDTGVQFQQLRLQQMQRILEISHEMASTISLDALLTQIVEASVELTESASAGILLFDAQRDALLFTIASNSAGKLPGIVVPIGSSIAGHVFVSGEPLIVSDVHTDPRYYAQVEQQVGKEAKSLLAVPLQYKGHRVGVLEVENKYAGQQFQAADIDVLMALAAHATIAIENARLYQQLEQHRDHLQELVDARTAELNAAVAEARQLNVQLEREIEEREKLILDLESFSHTVAHDLKNPLNLIISYSQMLPHLLADTEEAELRQFSNVIMKNGYRMARIIDELLTLASVRQQDVISVPVDMSAVLAEVEERLHVMIERAHTVLIKPQTWPVALGHAPWLEEVWANYISNGIKYGGDPPHLELGANFVPPAPEARHKLYVRFWIRDNGPGISTEIQPQLFSKFTRFSETRARGDGLGLSIVRRIVEKLGGYVGVESEAGRGSCFFFTLPADVTALSPLEMAQMLASDAAPTASPHGLGDAPDRLLPLLKDVAPDVLDALYHAAVAGDVLLIQSIIAGIADESPILGAALDELAEEFDYDHIIVLLERLESNDICTC